MCLAVPGKITEIYESGGLSMGKVDFGGALRQVCLEYVPEAAIGDYVVVHVGFALNLVNEGEAQETLALLHQMQDLGSELGL